MVWVPSPPIHTRLSRSNFLTYRTTWSEQSSVMSGRSGSFTQLKGLARLVVPRMVPPWVKMPDTFSQVKSETFLFTNPAKPSSIPITSISYFLIQALATPRITAFSPGQSPPPVKIPILFFCFFLLMLFPEKGQLYKGKKFPQENQHKFKLNHRRFLQIRR